MPDDLLNRLPIRTRVTPPPAALPVRTRPVPSAEMAKMKQHFNKNYGDGMMRTANLLPVHRHIETGAFTLDLALLGGLAENNAFMMYGAENSSKTTMMMKIVASFQRKYPEKTVVWVDPESTFDKLWAIKNGVDVDALELSQPNTGELAVDIVQQAMSVDQVSFVVLDSIGSLCPMNVLEKSTEDRTVGELARICSILCSKLAAVTNNERMRGHFPTLGMVNQFRDKVGVVYGNPNKLPGGRQINYYALTKIWMKGKKVVGNNEWGDEVHDHIIQSFTLEKSKVGSSIVQGEFLLHLNPSGVGKETDGRSHPQGFILDAKTVAAQAKKIGIISGGGASWGISEVNQRFGKLSEIEDFLYGDQSQFLRLKQRVLAQYRRAAGLPALPPDRYLLDWIPQGITV